MNGKDLLHLTKLISSSQVQMIIGTLAGVDETTPDIKENLGKVQKVISEIDQDRFPFLEHPGKIHFLFPSHGEGGNRKITKICISCFSTFLLQVNLGKNIVSPPRNRLHSRVNFFCSIGWCWTTWSLTIGRPWTGR